MISMRVLIVSQTNMAGAYCIGGLLRDTNENVRLMEKGGVNPYLTTPYNIGQIWELEFTKRNKMTPPHVEDIIVHQGTYLGRAKDFKGTLLDRVKVWRGNPNNLFDGMIRFNRGGSGYVSHQAGLPKQSVGFWLTSKPLYKFMGRYDRRRYRSGDYSTKITYVGTAKPIDVIPTNTLLRVSLSRWWKPDSSDTEERCYLQLSGWYL